MQGPDCMTMKSFPAASGPTKLAVQPSKLLENTGVPSLAYECTSSPLSLL